MRLAILFVLTMACVARAQGPVQTPWKYDAVTLTNGITLRGLILETNNQSVRLHRVLRQTGRPTITQIINVPRGEIARIDRLDHADREALAARLTELEQNSPQAEKERMEGLAVEEIAWNGKPGAGLRYVSDYFTLTSNEPEEIVRRSALRLEQIYAAYALFLPARHKSATTSVTLLQDQKEYQKSLPAGAPILNLAFFDPAANRIVCFSDLAVLGERLTAARKHHRQVRLDLETRRAEFAKLYKGKELERVTQPIRETLARLDRADALNTDTFDKATQRLFATLYHEAFHAYVGNFVYPRERGEFPRWLNEGLAQVFESAILEGRELRVGHADRTRLTRAKEAAGKGELVPLADLLRSGANQFLTSHIVERQSADRHYLTSWVLAFHITFDRRLLGTETMDRYVRALGAGGDPLSEFEKFIGGPLPKFESELRKYVQFLQADGTVVGGK